MATEDVSHVIKQQFIHLDPILFFTVCFFGVKMAMTASSHTAFDAFWVKAELSTWELLSLLLVSILPLHIQVFLSYYLVLLKLWGHRADQSEFLLNEAHLVCIP